MSNGLRRRVAMIAIILAGGAQTALAADQSFKDWTPQKGRWVHKQDIYAQADKGAPCLSFAKTAKWTDYTYELEARKISGSEGFLIIFRSADAKNLYWWNIGGWGNGAHGLEAIVKGRKKPITSKVRGSIKTGKWYRIAIQVAGPSIKCYLNGKLVHSITHHANKFGGIGLGTWNTQVQYRNIRVSTPDAKTLYRTKRVTHSPDMAVLTKIELTAEQKAKIAAERARLAKIVKDCPPIAFIKRQDYGMSGTNATMFARRTGRGAAICTYDPSKPDVAPKVVFETKEGFVFDMTPSFDGKKLVFSYKERNDLPFHIWEINIDGTSMRQITKGPFHDVSPIYYGDGRIIFTSSRVESFSLCQNFLACALYAVDADGTNMRRFDWTTLCTISPSVMSDGSILCTRWEYQDKNIFMWEGLWTINPNGRQLKLYHGNTLTVPNSVYGGKEIPGTKKVIVTMAAHHHPPLGDIAIVDRSLGVENPKGMTKITHATPYKITVGKNWRDKNWAPGDRLYRNSFTDPYPVTRDYSLVSDGRTGKYHIAMLKHDGLIVALYKDPKLQCFNAVALGKRPVPNIIPGQCPQEPGEGTFFVQDVYQGLLRQGVKRGQVKRLRIMAQSPKKYNTEGGRYHDHYPIIGQGSYYVKINLGTVPVADSGAAYFKVPSNTEIYFQALDANGKEIIRMGSVTQITTGEQASCIGCHEDRLKPSPVNPTNMKRMSKPPDKITPPLWGAGPVDYVKQVQPVLDKHCVKCHSGATPARGIDLSGDKTQFYSMSYQSLMRYVTHYYINPGPTGNFPAFGTGSWVSKLTTILESKHRSTSKDHELVDVDDTGRRRIYAWIDANVPYYSTWDMSRPWSTGGRDATVIPPAGDKRQRPKPAGWVARLKKVCDEKKIRLDARGLNFTNPQWSPDFVKLLAKSAGGVAPDDKARFKSTKDPDYQAILEILKEAKATLLAHPRIDMPGAKAIPQQRNFGKVY
ncbi:MAG: DUF1080 domain-containing protein [Phycisphaerales bacterium]|jgi:hypothetical protein|nr:DUF1080 domain-containing protein [Phycisphaerales bacterium]